jgi:hypothetical protein
MRIAEQPGLEGDICAFELSYDAAPLMVEAVSGRGLIIAPGDVFLGVPGHRESTRWVVGGIPVSGLAPGSTYWVLAQCGVVGELVGDSPGEKSHLGRVKFIGTACDESGCPVNLRHFAVTRRPEQADHGAPVYLVVGTSSEVGKTTAAISILRTLRKSGRSRIVALKAAGTSSVTELHSYQDFGATSCFDSVDFGLPTTYPSDRDGIGDWFETVLDECLSIPAEAVLVECGGDILGANVPAFLTRLRARRAKPTVILVASDSLAAMGAKSLLADMHLEVTLITGPCTDTPTIQARTQSLCGIPARNLARADGGFQLR